MFLKILPILGLQFFKIFLGIHITNRGIGGTKANFLVPKLFLGPKFFHDQIFFMTNNILGPKIFQTQYYGRPKFF